MVIIDGEGCDHLGGKCVHGERYESGFSDREVYTQEIFRLNEFAFEVFSHFLF